MPEEKEPTGGFKVVDRRLYGEDGRMREPAEDIPGNRETAAKDVPGRAPAPPSEQEEFSDGEVGGFAGVVQFLGTTAMFQLGLMEGPGGERIPADMVSGRHTINMLEILDRKTRGNLTPEESKLLEEVLFELRMSFVELEKRQTKKSK